jgi:glycosidase
MMIMAANHDTDRIGDVCEGDARKMKIVATLLCTMRGMPQILYGDELMFRATDRSKGHPTLRVDFPGGWGQGMTRIYDVLSHDFVYHDLSNMMIMAANHDTDRIGDVCEGDARRMKIVATLLCTMRGMPQILYGDELMFRSTDRRRGHPTLRVDFPGGWEGDKVDLFDRSQHTGDQKEVFDYTHKLMNWRKSKEVIHTGKTLHFIDRDNTYAFFRYNDKEVVFVYVNNSNKEHKVPWSRYAEINSELGAGCNVITGESVDMNNMAVEPMSTLVVEFKR